MTGLPERTQFQVLAGEIIARHPDVAAVLWAPRVESPGVDGSKHEALAGTGYYPVLYAEPSEVSEAAVGVDLSSEPFRLAALERAAKTDDPAVTDPILTLGPQGEEGTCLILLQVTSGRATDARAAAGSLGFLALTLRVRGVSARILDVPGGDGLSALDFELIDTDAAVGPAVIAAPASAGAAGQYKSWRFSKRFSIGGHRWELAARPRPAYVSSQLTSGPHLLGAAVTVVWWLLGGLGLATVQRARDAGSRAQSRIIEAALRSLSEGFIVADKSGQFVLFNSAAERLLGMGRVDVGVAGWSQTYGCFHPDGRTPFPSAQLPLARALHGETSTADVFIRNQHVPDGVWIHIKGAPLRDERGRPDGGVVVFDDVTAARLGEERLRASVAESLRLSNAVDQTADAIMITNRSGTIEYVNPAFEATTGYSRAEALGQTPRLLRSGKQLPEFHERLWKTILAGHVFRGSPVNRRKNGELYNADQTITPIKDAEGRITHFVSVLKDATDRIRIEQQDLEMRYAREVQQRLFPAPSTSVPGLDVAGATFPALATCGDYYDFIPLENGALAVVTADVSGHGLGPALIMAQTRASLRILTTSCPNPGEVLTRMNVTLHADLDENRVRGADPGARRPEDPARLLRQRRAPVRVPPRFPRRRQGGHAQLRPAARHAARHQLSAHRDPSARGRRRRGVPDRRHYGEREYVWRVLRRGCRHRGGGAAHRRAGRQHRAAPVGGGQGVRRRIGAAGRHHGRGVQGRRVNSPVTPR